jgi:hypothetical protein
MDANGVYSHDKGTIDGGGYGDGDKSKSELMSVSDAIDLVKSRSLESLVADTSQNIYAAIAKLTRSEAISAFDEFQERQTNDKLSKLSNPSGYLVKILKRRMSPALSVDERDIITSLLKEAVTNITEGEIDSILKSCNSDIYKELSFGSREAALSGLREVHAKVVHSSASLPSAVMNSIIVNTFRTFRDRQRGRDRRSRSRSEDHRRRRSRSRSRDRSSSRSRKRSRSPARDNERKRNLSSKSEVRGKDDPTASIDKATSRMERDVANRFTQFMIKEFPKGSPPLVCIKAFYKASPESSNAKIKVNKEFIVKHCSGLDWTGRNPATDLIVPSSSGKVDRTGSKSGGGGGSRITEKEEELCTTCGEKHPGSKCRYASRRKDEDYEGGGGDHSRINTSVTTDTREHTNNGGASMDGERRRAGASSYPSSSPVNIVDSVMNAPVPSPVPHPVPNTNSTSLAGKATSILKSHLTVDVKSLNMFDAKCAQTRHQVVNYLVSIQSDIESVIVAEKRIIMENSADPVFDFLRDPASDAAREYRAAKVQAGIPTEVPHGHAIPKGRAALSTVQMKHFDHNVKGCRQYTLDCFSPSAKEAMLLLGSWLSSKSTRIDETSSSFIVFMFVRMLDVDDFNHNYMTLLMVHHVIMFSRDLKIDLESALPYIVQTCARRARSNEDTANLMTILEAWESLYNPHIFAPVRAGQEVFPPVAEECFIHSPHAVLGTHLPL